jgi:hypothetical protein
MPPDHARVFGEGAASTVLGAPVLVAMLLAIILILVLPRKYVCVPLLVMFFLVPPDNQVFVAGVHLFVYRILILVGLLRMIGAKTTEQGDSLVAGGFNTVDSAFLVSTCCQAFAAVLLFLNTEALINQGGFLLDCIGGYFLLRFLIRDDEDTYRVIKCFAFLTFILAIGMLIEHYRQVNVFGVLLGSMRTVPDVRDGAVRSQGTFAHELLAGTFGATLLPLFFLLWKNGKAKLMAAVGVVCTAIMTWTSNSSTSLLAWVAGIVAVCFWPVRGKMRTVRWGIVGGLVLLQLVMKAPIWFVIAHVDLTGSSSSWHRAAIVDAFIRHFGDWWLLGVKDTGSWGWDMWDAQNQFVAVGESGGVVAFAFFIAMITRSFGRLGNARRTIEGKSAQEWSFWFLGSALFAHVVGFFGVNYFDQTKFAWFALLAMISASTAPFLREAAATETTKPNDIESVALRYSSPSDLAREPTFRPLRPVNTRFSSDSRSQVVSRGRLGSQKLLPHDRN